MPALMFDVVLPNAEHSMKGRHMGKVTGDNSNLWFTTGTLEQHTTERKCGPLQHLASCTPRSGGTTRYFKASSVKVNLTESNASCR